MIHFVEHKDIIPEKWNDAVRHARQATLLTSYDVLDTLTANSSWNALILNNYQAIMPLPERKKFGIHYLYTPFFIPQFGIFAQQSLEAETIFDFFNNIPKKYKQIDLLLNIQNDVSLLKQKTIHLISHKLNLNQSYENLYAHFSQNTKRNIKDARKHALSYEVNPNILDDVILLFKENKGDEKMVHYREKDYQILANTARLLLEKNAIDVIGVRHEQQLIAGAFFVKDIHCRWFWFSGRDTNASQFKPMFFLLDEFIRQHAEQQEILDFNGSLNKNVARLYTGFGAQPYPIPMVTYSQPGCWQTLINIYHTIKK